MKKLSSIEDFKQKYRVTIDLPVAWGEMDLFHHVNNIFYFRYFESVRMHYMGLIGALDYLKQHNVGPILAATDCKFITPVTWPDDLIVGARIDIESMGDDRFEMSYGVWSKKQSKLAAVGSSMIVYYDYNGLTKAKIPTELRQSINNQES
ncbi:MAG TPA: acyl-CoA thioesterase [Bacteriovoracaceae bacterium]|nr:acyl-CoA thioesterase [Bacteriovoracaceae bacterium]